MDERVGICHWEGFQIQFYRKMGGIEQIQKLLVATRALVKSSPRGHVSLAIISPGIGVPSSEVREATRQFMGQYEKERKAAAAVFEDAGALALLLASMLRGFNTLAGRKQLMIYRTVAETASHFAPILTEITGQPLTPANLVSIVDRARQLTAVERAQVGVPG